VNRILIRLAVCAALTAGLTQSARADLITGSVQFDPSLSTTKVYSTVGDPKDPDPGIAFKNWTSTAFTNVALPVHGTITGDLVAFGLEKAPSAHFGGQGNGTPFGLTFDIHDGNISGAITFSGLLHGTLKKDAGGKETSTLSIDWLGATTKSLDLDHHIYQLSISDLVRSGTFADTAGLGQFDVDVKVTHNPEPASLVLAAIGLPALSLTWLRRKRKARRRE
jgi:hypothetical protein